MTHFQTVVSPVPSNHKMAFSDPVMAIGSCFAEAMADRLAVRKMAVTNNPFGTLYNPLSIHKALRYAVSNEPASQHTYLQRQGIFLNYDFHSEISSLDGDILKNLLREKIAHAHRALKSTRWLLITYGTAWAYTRTDTGEVVANCHKMPAQQFSKTLLSEAQVVSSFEGFYETLRGVNPGLQIILTVSPVRHVKDTLELNSVSKAVLRVACHNIAHQFKNVGYFPAFEMMMDDLRDYRFYGADMIHPTPVAEDYIWEKFMATYFTPELQSLVARWDQVRTALAHRAFHPTSAAHQQFLRDTLAKLEELKETLPVDKEIADVRSQLLS